jgi:hypothetical protein
LIDVHDAVVSDVDFRWVGRQTPQYLEPGCPTDHEERHHAPAALPVRFEQQYADR